MKRAAGSRPARVFRTTLAPFALALALAGPAQSQVSAVEEEVEASIDSQEGPYRVVRVVEGLSHPWAVAWLPDGRMLVTERAGRLHLVDGGEVAELTGLPQIDTEEDQRTAPEGGNQGGLLDVAVHPDYEDNGWIYFTYSSPGDDDSVIGDAERGTATALARASLDEAGGTLVGIETLYAQVPRRDPGRHYGSRIVFLGDGTLVFSIGDRGLRFPSQDLTDPGGAMIRLRDDGTVPDDNPFVDAGQGMRPEIFSFGHRNNQGMARHPETGEIWTSEHGPQGGDVLHRVQAGGNYGWPQVTLGVEYSTGEHIGVRGAVPGVVEPVHVWEETVAPSGLDFFTGDRFPGWDGNLFAGSLLQEQVRRLVLNDGAVTYEETLLDGIVGRIRDVKQGPDGLLYVVTDEGDGGVYRLEPAQAEGAADEGP